jgi:hypothetical protein
MGFCEVFSWGLIFSIHGRNLDPGHLDRPLLLYYAEKIDENNDLGRTREKNSPPKGKPHLKAGKLSTHKNNPGLGLGVIVMVDYLAHTSPLFYRLRRLSFTR